MKLKKGIIINESGFVFNPETGDSFSINEVGADLLHLIKEEKNLQEIKEFMILKYDVDEMTVERYYYDYVNSLTQYKFFE